MSNVISKLIKKIPKANSSELSDTVKWGIAATLVVAVIVYFLAQFIAVQIIYIYPAIKGWSVSYASSWLANSVYAQFFFILVVEALTVGSFLFYMRMRGSRVSAIGLKKPKLEDIAYALSGFLIYFIVYYVAIIAATFIFKHLNLNEGQNVGFNSTYSGFQFWLVFISLVILPPIAEEIMFRGFIFSGLRKKLPFIWAAVITSLLFAVPHLFEGKTSGLLWVAGIDTFILSMVLTGLREKTGRLTPGMGLHALKNFVAFASIYIFHIH